MTRVILTISEGKFAGREIAIEPNHRKSFGRVASKVDVSFDTDGHMSGRHFSVENSGTTALLLDLGSTNGTFLNRNKVQDAQLRDGDQIVAGSQVISVRLIAPQPAVQSPLYGQDRSEATVPPPGAQPSAATPFVPTAPAPAFNPAPYNPPAPSDGLGYSLPPPPPRSNNPFMSISDVAVGNALELGPTSEPQDIGRVNSSRPTRQNFDSSGIIPSPLGAPSSSAQPRWDSFPEANSSPIAPSSEIIRLSPEAAARLQRPASPSSPAPSPPVSAPSPPPSPSPVPVSNNPFADNPIADSLSLPTAEYANPLASIAPPSSSPNYGRAEPPPPPFKPTPPPPPIPPYPASQPVAQFQPVAQYQPVRPQPAPLEPTSLPKVVSPIDSSEAYVEPITDEFDPESPSTSSKQLKEQQGVAASGQKLPTIPDVTRIFEEEPCSSGLVAYRCMVPDMVENFAPSALLQLLGINRSVVMILHCQKGGKPTPSELTGAIPLLDWLPEEASFDLGPVIVPLSELIERKMLDLVDTLWTCDGAIAFFGTNQAAIVDHLRKLIHAGVPGLSLEGRPFYYCWPSTLSSFLLAQGAEVGQVIMSPAIESVAMELPDVPVGWQVFARPGFRDTLVRRGFVLESGTAG